MDKRRPVIIVIFLAVILIGLAFYWQYEQARQRRAAVDVSAPELDTYQITLHDRILRRTPEEVEKILGKHISEDTASEGDILYREYKAEGKTITVYFDRGIVIGITN